MDRSGPRTRRTPPRQAGFTLLELMIAIAVLVVIASISLPMYQSALQVARVAKARQELRTMSSDIDRYAARSGYYPLTLHEIGHGDRRDPWGQGYVYLNFATGSGDNLAWAVAAGVLDPTIVNTGGGGGASSTGGLDPNGGGSGGGGSGGGGVVGALRDQASQAPVGSSSRNALEMMVEQVERRETDPTLGDLEDLPDQLEIVDDVEAVRRKDRFLFPLNTDYDLFSLGSDRVSAVQLGSPPAFDDVIRANNGGFFGLASEY